MSQSGNTTTLDISVSMQEILGQFAQSLHRWNEYWRLDRYRVNARQQAHIFAAIANQETRPLPWYIRALYPSVGLKASLSPRELLSASERPILLDNSKPDDV